MPLPPFAADPATAWTLVEDNPFALVVTPGPDGIPLATRAPVVRAPDDPDVLWGHLARANPHWRSFAGGSPVLAVFSGPHGYVSPSLYDTTPAVPTWNYAEIQAVGRITPFEDPERTLAVLDRTIAVLEAGRPKPWDPRPSREHFRRILSGIVAFEIAVESVGGTVKLSQDKPAHIRERVAGHFRADPAGRHAELADLMDRTHSQEAPR